MTFSISMHDEANDAAWDAFVEKCPDGTFFHRVGWRNVVSRAFGHRGAYVAARRGQSIVGVLPLFEIRSLLFGRTLVSTPFCVYGGAIGEDAAVCSALEEFAVAMARERGVRHLELRRRAPSGAARQTKDLYYTFRKAIHSDPEKNLAEIPRKQRAMVRKGIAAGLRSRVDPAVDTLYSIYSESLRNLGTPVFGKRYLKLLQEEFRECCEIRTVLHEERPIASVLSFYFRDEVLPYYGGSVSRARDVAGNDFMYWEVMRAAAEKGAAIFDYGRSKRGTGAFKFKEHWGFEATPLHYEYELVRARSLPDLSPANPSFSLPIRAWQKLPLAISRLLGPPIARALG